MPGTVSLTSVVAHLSHEAAQDLQSLNIAGNGIDDIDPSFSELSSLTELNCSNNSLEAGPWISLLASLPQLRSLDLRGNPLCSRSRPEDSEYWVRSLLPQLEWLNGQGLYDHCHHHQQQQSSQQQQQQQQPQLEQRLQEVHEQHGSLRVSELAASAAQQTAECEALKYRVQLLEGQLAAQEADKQRLEQGAGSRHEQLKAEWREHLQAVRAQCFAAQQLMQVLVQRHAQQQAVLKQQRHRIEHLEAQLQREHHLLHALQREYTQVQHAAEQQQQQQNDGQRADARGLLSHHASQSPGTPLPVKLHPPVGTSLQGGSQQQVLQHATVLHGASNLRLHPSNLQEQQKHKPQHPGQNDLQPPAHPGTLSHSTQGVNSHCCESHQGHSTHGISSRRRESHPGHSTQGGCTLCSESHQGHCRESHPGHSIQGGCTHCCEARQGLNSLSCHHEHMLQALEARAGTALDAMERRLGALQLQARLATKAAALQKHAKAQELSASFTQRTQLQSMATAAQTREAQLQAALSAAHTKQEQLQSELNTSCARASQLQSELAASHAHREQLQAELLACSGTVTCLQSELAAAHAHEAELRAGLAESVRVVEQERDAVRAAHAYEEALRQQLQEAESRVKGAEREAAKAQVQAKQLERHLGRLDKGRASDTTVIHGLQEKLDARECALRAAQRERNSLLALLRGQIKAAGGQGQPLHGCVGGRGGGLPVPLLQLRGLEGEI